MKSTFDRVLLVQQEGELANYTMALLDEIGFRHVVHSSDIQQAEKLWRHALEKKKPFQLVVCDDDVVGGCLTLQTSIAPCPFVVFSHVTNAENLRLAAKIGLHGLIFRPYGRAQLERALKAVLA